MTDHNTGATAPDAAHDIKTRMRADLKAAMAARQSAAVATLRTLIAAIDNSEAPAAPQTAQTHDFLSGSAEVARLELSREDIDRILRVEIAEREAAATQMDELGQTTRAADLRAASALTRTYLSGGR